MEEYEKMKVTTSITIKYDVMLKVKNRLKPREFSALIESLLEKWAEYNIIDEEQEKTKEELAEEEAKALVILQKIKDKKQALELEEKERQTKLEEEGKKTKVLFNG